MKLKTEIKGKKIIQTEKGRSVQSTKRQKLII